MTDWISLLRESDRAHEARAAPADFARMRQAAVAEARRSGRRAPHGWPRPFVVTAAGLLVVSTGMLTVLRPHSKIASTPPAADAGAGQTSERTQLQFSTPGGTRLIWVFDADFDIRGEAR
jgi:hypothetical protein